MKRKAFKLISILFFAQLALNVYSQTKYEIICKDKIKETEKQTITGNDGWLFLRRELAHISKGAFYGNFAVKTSECTQSDRQDPIPAIVDFNNQLKNVGITLYFMPVPPKALIYADKVDQIAKADNSLYNNYNSFFKELRKQGVNVVDLFPVFTQAKTNGTLVYCKQDSHWSPEGIQVASRFVANKIKKEMPYQKYATKKITEKPVKSTIQITGDLWLGQGIDNMPKEKVTINTYNKASVPDSNSPVLIIGDSHCLIFHSGGDMLATNSGLLGGIASDLGFSSDLIAVKGSGTNSVRIDLYRKAQNKEWLDKKKVIIWCFASRDLSESRSGWRKVPVKK